MTAGGARKHLFDLRARNPAARLADPVAAPNVPVAEALEPLVERGPRLHHDGELGLR